MTLAIDSKWGHADGPLPRHVAVIMDGNGRWAAERHLPRVEGHRQGVEAVRQVVEASMELGVTHLTLFSFSSENWTRPVQGGNQRFVRPVAPLSSAVTLPNCIRMA